MSHEILRPTFTRQDERGIFRELLNSGHWESVIQGEMQPGAVMGNHYHKETVVFFFLLSGRVEVITEDIASKAHEQFTLNALEGVILQPNVSHALTFEEGGQFLLLKSKQYDPKNPDTYHHAVK